jgi:hypothetical protein
LGAVAFASEDSPVFERKRSLHSCSSVWIFRILSGIAVAAKHGTERGCGKLDDSLRPLRHFFARFAVKGFDRRLTQSKAFDREGREELAKDAKNAYRTLPTLSMGQYPNTALP